MYVFDTWTFIHLLRAINWYIFQKVNTNLTILWTLSMEALELSWNSLRL